MTITALPTTYSGVEFRSRLEADWAATLDDNHITWTYEPEGYQLSDGTLYLPDFHLPNVRAWLEVKGEHMDRYSKVEQFAADLWAESGSPGTYDAAAPMVLLGQQPRQNRSYVGDAPYFSPSMVGVMGPGKKYSVGFTRCGTCRAHTIFAFGQDFCRACFATGEDVKDELYGGWLDWMAQQRRFIRVPRPFQGGRR